MKSSFPVWIYLLALVLRLIPVILSRGLGIGLDDMFQYDMLARSLASGNGFRWYAQTDLNQLVPYIDFDLSTVKEYDPVRGIATSFRAPLYPAFLAVVYFFSGKGFVRFFAARVAQVIFLGAPLAPLTYFVSIRISPLLSGEGLERRAATTGSVEAVRSERISRLAAWTVAVYPILLIYPLGLGTENPFFVLLLSSFLFLIRSIERSSSQNLLLSGFFLGLTALTRSVILPFAALASLYLFYIHRRRALLALLSFVIVIAPWMIRNSLLHHKLTGIETSMGYNLYLGYYPRGNGSFIFGPSLDLLTILDDAQRDQVGMQKALLFIRAQPERFVPLAVNRLGFFFGLEKRVLMYFYSNGIIGYIPKALLLTISAIVLLPFVLVSTSAALGLGLSKWRPASIMLALLFVSYLLPHVFILAEDRFHLALIPFLAILAAQIWVNGMRGLLARWQESSTGKIAVILSVCAVIVLFTNWSLELARDADKISQLLAPDGNQTHFPY
jgi:hypothetical protein